VSATASHSSHFLRRAPAAFLLLMLPLLACTPTTNDPDEYDAVTEANVLDACIRSGMEDPGDSRIVEVDDQADDDSSNDEVVFTQEVPADLRDPCECLYDGMTEIVGEDANGDPEARIPFPEFKDLDLDFEELIDGAGDGGDGGGGGGTTSTTAATEVVETIAEGCGFSVS